VKSPTRRSVLAGAAVVPVAALRASAQTGPSALTAAQMRTLEAFVDRLIPADELGPGAVAAGAHRYIDTQLAGYLAGEKAAFAEGLDLTDAYARRTHGGAFAELSPEQRDAVLTALEAGRAEGFTNARNFFNRARRLTLEGTFGDPHYGVGPEMQRLGTPAVPYRRSAWGAEHQH